MNCISQVENQDENSDSNNQSTSSIPFTKVDVKPVFPGCSGSDDEKFECFRMKINNHFISNFNADLSNELGLAKGKLQIFIFFSIDQSGNSEISLVRAPHPGLKAEAERVVKLIPKMIPAIYKDEFVGTKYFVPLAFLVE